MHIEMRRHWWMCTSIDQRPWSTLWLHCAITSVAAGNQWSGPVKAISKWFHWFAPLVSCSDWLDRKAEWESGLRGLNPLKRPVSLCRLGAEPTGKTRQPVWTGGWTLWKDPSACVDGGLNPLERPVSLCGLGAEPSLAALIITIITYIYNRLNDTLSTSRIHNKLKTILSKYIHIQKRQS